MADGVVRVSLDAVRAEAGAAAERLAAAKAEAPPGLPFGPGRGPLRLVCDWAALPGGTRRLQGHHWEAADAFDRMCRAAALLHRRSGGEGAAVLPFTWGQIAIGRHYLALTERHMAGGVHLSALERSGGGTGGLAWIDAHIAVRQEIAGLHRRIGDAEAMEVRRIRPSQRGTRRGIPDRALVDLVCLGGRTLAEVLRAHGWCNDGKHREVLRMALVAALDRMQGVAARRPQNGA